MPILTIRWGKDGCFEMNILAMRRDRPPRLLTRLSRDRAPSAPLKDSIARRVDRVCVCLYLAAACLIAGLEAVSAFSRARAESMDQIASIAAQSIAPLSKAIWSFDAETVQLILGAFSQDKAVGGVVLLDERGAVEANLWRAGESESTAADAIAGLGRAKVYRLTYSRRGTDFPIGTLVIWPSSVAERGRVIDSLSLAGVRTAAIVLLLYVILVIVVDRLVGRPLRELSLQLAQAEPTACGEIELKRRSRGYDEFDLVISALNAMVARVREGVSALRESERRLLSLFEDSPIAIWDEDFSAIRRKIDEAHAGGIVDWAAFFAPSERVREFISLIELRAVNRAALAQLGYPDKDALAAGLPAIFVEGQPRGLPRRADGPRLGAEGIRMRIGPGHCFGRVHRGPRQLEHRPGLRGQLG
jgi:hypothetical protein